MSRLVRWAIAGGVIVVFIVTIVLVLKHWMSGSATGTVHTGTPTATSQPSLPQAPQTTTVDTPYFSSVLPAGFVIKRNQTSTATPLTELEFSANTDARTGQQVGITIGELPSGGLSNLGDYLARSKDTTTYAPATLPGLPSGAFAFRTVSSPAALAVFWLQGSRYAEVSISTDGSATLDQLQATYQQLISTWQWK
jgi:hypothetical protein